MDYIETPINPIRVGRVTPMTKSKTTTEALAKVYNKTRGEHLKDMVIVALVVGIVAFGLGFKFNSDRNAEMQSAVKAAQVTAVAPEVKK